MIARLTPWLITALALAACATVIISALRRESELKASQEKAAEAKRLEAEGQILEVEGDKKALTLALEHAMTSELAVAIEASKKVAPKAKIIRVVEASTGPIICGLSSAGNEPQQQLQLTGEPQCLLRLGDIGEVRVREIELQTKLDNHLVVGTAEAWRLQPEPAVKLFGGPFKAETTRVIELDPPAEQPKLEWWQHELIGAVAGAGAMLLMRR